MLEESRPEDPDGKTVPSKSTVLRAFEALNTVLFRTRKDINDHYHRQDREKILSYIDSLVRSGDLIKGRWAERCWYGFTVVRQLAETYFSSSLSNGCLSWDLAVVVVLMFVLQSSLTARAGDVGRLSYYTGDEYLVGRMSNSS